MIIDKDGFCADADTLRRLINRHGAKLTRYGKLESYYRGDHDILGRSRVSAGVPNNRIVCNHARYITDMVTAYMISNPVTYSSSAGMDIEPVKNCYYAQSISDLDAELERTASVYGHSYELLYADEEAQPRSALIMPPHGFIVYSDATRHEKLLGVHYYRPTDVDGRQESFVRILAADKERVTVYRMNPGANPAPEESYHHYFGDVPMIEYRNNRLRQGDFEQEISLIDAYNLLISDRVNDKEQFVDGFLMLAGIDLSTSKAKELKEQKILMGDSDGRAEYLSKLLGEADTEVLRKALKEDIHRFAMVPDLSDEMFANNLSGVAIRYKLMGFEQKVRGKERLFEAGLRERFAMYNTFLGVKCNMPRIPLHGVDVEFKRNLPVNEYETARMIRLLDGIASRETLLSRLPFVTDAAEEADLSKKEMIYNV